MKILIADKLASFAQSALGELGCQIRFDPALKHQSLEQALTQFQPHILIVRSTRVTPKMLDLSKNLSLIIRAGAGTNTIAVREAAQKGIFVANCPGKNALAVAELALGLILASDRQIPQNTRDLAQNIWNKKKYSAAQGIFGRTLGIVGLGRIGQEVAHRARAFGLHICAWDPLLPEEVFKDLKVERKATLLDLAKVSDIVSVHLALNTETQGLLNQSFFKALKKGAIFVNTARGGLVDEDALLQAIKDKELKVALDVYAHEPANTFDQFQTPFAQQELFIGTHHIGASTQQAQHAVAQEVVDIVRHYLHTGEVKNVVNLIKSSPAKYLLVVRHLDRVGVLAEVLKALRQAEINVQEMSNIIFEGAEAAVARIQIDQPLMDKHLKEISEYPHVLSVDHLPL